MTNHDLRPGDDENRLRGTGRTTRLAIWYLQECLNNAGEWITIRDHWNTHQADRRLWSIVLNMFDDLNVRTQYRSNNEGYKIRVIPIGPTNEKEGPQ